VRAVSESRDIGDVQAVPVDAARRAHGDRDAGRRPDHGGIELLPLLLALLLGVVESRQGEPLRAADPLQVDQHPGREQRAGQGAAAGLINTGDEAAAEGAVEPE
jgi:hypothetical protein